MQKTTVDYGKSLMEAWKKLSVFDGLNDHDVNEIMKVQELYCLHLSKGRDVPDTIRYVTEESGFLYFFTMKTSKAAVAASTIQYQASTWEQRMLGRGKLRIYALDIIGEICGYQTTTKMDQDSAECMFLEEIKHWATYELSLYELRKENMEQIEHRVRYFEAVLSQDKLFYSIKWKRRTAQQIILACTQRLKYSVIPDIRNEMALQCAREKLSVFRFELKEALQQGAYFLYHVFRDSGDIHPEVITLNKLMEGSATKTMRTGSGKLLHHVLTCGAFSEAFPDEVGKTRRILETRNLAGEYTEPENEMDSSTLYGPTGSLCLPLSLWLDMADPKSYQHRMEDRDGYAGSAFDSSSSSNKKKGKERWTSGGGRPRSQQISDGRTPVSDNREKTNNPFLAMLSGEELESGRVELDRGKLELLFAAKLETKRTGMEAAFNGHATVAEQFVKAHAQLHELSKFVQILIKAEKCAGGGGDLLLYGFANKQLNALLDSYRSMVKMIRSQFEFVLRISELRFQDLVQKNEAEPERNTFVPHYREIHNKFYQFSNQLERTDEYCENILNEANSLTLMERFQKLQRDTDSFISSADLFSKHVNRVMGIPYNPAVGQKILLVGSGVQSADRLLEMVKSYASEDLECLSNLSFPYRLEDVMREEGEEDGNVSSLASSSFDVVVAAGNKDGHAKKSSNEKRRTRRISSSLSGLLSLGTSSDNRRSSAKEKVPVTTTTTTTKNNNDNLYKAFEYLDKSACGALKLYEAPPELVRSCRSEARATPSSRAHLEPKPLVRESLPTLPSLPTPPSPPPPPPTPTVTTTSMAKDEGQKKVTELEKQLDVLRIEKTRAPLPSTRFGAADVAGKPHVVSSSAAGNKRPRLSRNSRRSMNLEKDNDDDEDNNNKNGSLGRMQLISPPIEELGDEVLFELPNGTNDNGEPYDWISGSKKAKKYHALKRKQEARTVDASSRSSNGGGDSTSNDGSSSFSSSLLMLSDVPSSLSSHSAGRGNGNNNKKREEYEEWMENKFDPSTSTGRRSISFDNRKYVAAGSDSTAGIFSAELDAYLAQKDAKKCLLSLRSCFRSTLPGGYSGGCGGFLEILCWKSALAKLKCLDLSHNRFNGKTDFLPLVTLVCHPNCRINLLLMIGCGLTDDDFGPPPSSNLPRYRRNGDREEEEEKGKGKDRQKSSRKNNPHILPPSVAAAGGARWYLTDVLRSTCLKRWVLCDNPGISDRAAIQIQNALAQRIAEGNSRLSFLHLGCRETLYDSRGGGAPGDYVGSFGTASLNAVRQNVHLNLGLFISFENASSSSSSSSPSSPFGVYAREYEMRLAKNRKEKIEGLRKAKDMHEKRSRTADRFKYLVRVCQVYARNVGGCRRVPYAFIRTAFSVPFYGIPKAFSDDTIAAHVHRACQLNVLFATTKSDNGNCYVLSETLVNYEAPLPETVSLLMALANARQLDLVAFMPLFQASVVGASRSIFLPGATDGGEEEKDGDAVVVGCEYSALFRDLSKRVPFNEFPEAILQALLEYGKILGTYYCIDVDAEAIRRSRPTAIADSPAVQSRHQQQQIVVRQGDRTFPPLATARKGRGKVITVVVINPGTICPLDVLQFPR